MDATTKPEKVVITASFSPSFMVTMIELWRNTVDMKVPSHDDLKMHFIQNRRSILQNFWNTGTAWSMLLDAMTPATAADNETLLAARETAREFSDWAKAEIAQLDEVAMQEAIQAGWDDLAATAPDEARRIQDAFSKLPKRPGDSDSQ